MLHTACCVLGIATALQAQQPAPQPLNWREGDSARVARLEASGRRVTGTHVVVYAPTERMTAERQAALVDSLDRGVAELRRLTGSPLPWQRLGARPIHYYLAPDTIISHASGLGAVFISVHRALDGRAPWLHEASHELLAPPPPFFGSEYPDSAAQEAAFDSWPLWLAEGLADVLALRAAQASGITEGDIFSIGGLASADSTCAARLDGNPYRADIMRVMGGSGLVEALFTTERARVAPTFYACAQSMANFYAATVGVERMVALFPVIRHGSWTAALEQAAGLPLDTLRARWRGRIGVE